LFCAGRTDTVAMKETAIVPRNCIVNLPKRLLELGTRGYLKPVFVKNHVGKGLLYFILFF